MHLEQDEVFNSSPVLPILALPVLGGGILALPVLAGGHGGRSGGLGGIVLRLLLWGSSPSLLTAASPTQFLQWEITLLCPVLSL